MKITIEGSPREVAELMGALLNGAETEAKKPYFPPLLTELSDAEKTINSTREIIASLNKMNEVAKQRKENAPQAEATERKTNQEILEKQMKLLSNVSENCVKFDELVKYAPALTHAMIEIQSYLRKNPV